MKAFVVNGAFLWVQRYFPSGALQKGLWKFIAYISREAFAATFDFYLPPHTLSASLDFAHLAAAAPFQ